MARVKISLDKLEKIQSHREAEQEDLNSWLRRRNVELEIIQDHIFLISNKPEDITQFLLMH